MTIEQVIEILDKNSEKAFEKLSNEEVVLITNLLTDFVVEIERSSPEVVRNLLDLKFGASQNTVLHLAAKFGCSDQLEKILSFVSDHKYVDVRNSDLFTPLHFAAQSGSLPAVSYLLASGADKDSVVSPQRRRWTAIHYAAQYGHLEIVKALIKAGVNKEVKTSFGLTPLVVGAEFGHLKIVEFMLSIGAEINVQTVSENHNMTALHYAAVGNFKDVAIALLGGGIDREKETALGLTALEFAAKADFVEMVAIILSFGAGKLNSALEIAQKSKSLQSAEKIKKYRKAVDNFFNLSWLEKEIVSLTKAVKQFDIHNLSEPKIILADGVVFNAYGILSIKHEVGFIKKSVKSFPEFLFDAGEGELNSALKNLNKLVSQKALSRI